MTKEVWATYSVKDHQQPRAFIDDVMFYDRLVLPVPPRVPDEVRHREWSRWEQNNWDPSLQSLLIKILGDLAITVEWNDKRQQDWKKRHDAVKSDAFWLTGELLRQGLPVYTQGVVAALGANYPSLHELKQDVEVEGGDGPSRLPRVTLSAVLGREFLVVDTPERSQEYQLELAVDLAHDPDFRAKRAALTAWEQDFLENGVTDEQALKKAVRDMRELVEDQQNVVRKRRRTMSLRYGYRIGLASILAVSPFVLGPVGIALVAGGAFLSIGELVLDESLFKARPETSYSPAAFFIAANKAFAQQ